MILDLETEIFLIAFAVIAVGATIQGLAGFGMNTLAAPLLFMLEPDMVPGPILVAALFHTMMTAWRERGDIKFNEVGRMYVGAVLGILAGTATAAALSDDGLGVVIAVVILAAVGVMIFGVVLPRTRSASVLTGAAAGFTGSTSAVGGPPVALYLSRFSGPELRSTMGAFFLVAALTAMGTLAVFGEFSVRQFVWGLFLVPFVGLGFVVSSPLRKFIDDGHRLRRAILALSAVAALALLVRSLV